MKNYLISHCSISDSADMHRLEKVCFDQPYTKKMFDEMLCDPQYINLKADSDGDLIGYVAIQTILDEAHLISIAVNPVHQGKGIGKELLKKAAIKAKESGAKQIFLEVNQKNSAAINLYLNFGFKQIAIRQKYYKEDAAVIMLLPLKTENKIITNDE